MKIYAKASAILVALGLLLCVPSAANIVVRPFTYTNGTPADANQVNTNENTLYTLVNGNIDSTNINPTLGLNPALLKCASAPQCLVSNPFAFIIQDTVNTTIPLLVEGTAGGSQPFFDVNGGGADLLHLEANGNLVLFGALLGNTSIGSFSTPSLAVSGDVVAQTSSTAGGFDLGGASSSVRISASAGVVTLKNSAATNMGLTFATNGTVTSTLTANTNGTFGWVFAGGANHEVDISGQVAANTGAGGVLGYVPPLYTVTGAATAIPHSTFITCTTSGSTTCTVNLSGAGAFSGVGTFACSNSAQTGSAGLAATATINSASQVVLNDTVSGTNILQGVCTGT